jgi:hypothetical protein
MTGSICCSVYIVKEAGRTRPHPVGLEPAPGCRQSRSGKPSRSSTADFMTASGTYGTPEYRLSAAAIGCEEPFFLAFPELCHCWRPSALGISDSSPAIAPATRFFGGSVCRGTPVVLGFALRNKAWPRATQAPASQVFSPYRSSAEFPEGEDSLRRNLTSGSGDSIPGSPGAWPSEGTG